MSTPNGPQLGQTPAHDSDLHANGDNPYSQGSPRVDLTNDLGARFNTPGMSGYYINPAPDTENPYSSGFGVGGSFSPSDQSASRDTVDGLGNAYLDRLANQNPAQSGEDSPGASAYFNDQGFGPSGQGRS